MGVVKDLLVSHEHCSCWFLTSDPSDKDATLIPFRPWMTFGSGDPHMTLLDKYQHAVHTFIITHPGVTMVSLYINHASVKDTLYYDDL